MSSRKLRVCLERSSLALLLVLAASVGSAAEEVARVVGVEGSALVRTGSGEPRLVELDGVIRAGDTIVTATGAGVGLLAGQHYIGLAESTTARIGRTDQ